MAFEVVHSFVSEKADGLDSTVVQPSNWNDDHVLTMATGKVLGRMTAGTGAVEELPIFVDSTGQSMILPSGTTAERPATPANGMQRYNTTLGQIEAYQNDTWGNLADTAQAVMAEATVKGRATGAGTGAPQNLTKAQLQRLVYNVGNAYPTFNSTADDGFVFPFGQNLNRTTYAALFAKWGTTYGAGDGSTTFGVPDVRGRTIAGKDNMGGTSANRLTGLSGGIDGDVLGGTGGAESHVLTLAQLAAHTHTGNTGNDTPDHSHTFGVYNSDPAGGVAADGSGGATANAGTSGASTRHTHPFTTASTGSDTAHNNVQPTIVANYQIYTGVHA